MKTISKMFEAILTTDATRTWAASTDAPTSMWGWGGYADSSPVC